MIQKVHDPFLSLCHSSLETVLCTVTRKAKFLVTTEALSCQDLACPGCFCCMFPLSTRDSSGRGMWLAGTKAFRTVSFCTPPLLPTYLQEVDVRSRRLLFGISATSPIVPQMSAALPVKPAMEFLLAHKCRFNLFAFASDLYQHNEVWDLMGSCQNQIPLTLIPAPCSV